MMVNMYKVYGCLVTEDQLILFDKVKREGNDCLTWKRSNARRYKHHQLILDLAVVSELYKIYIKEGDSDGL